MLLFLASARTTPRRAVWLWIWQSRRVGFSRGYGGFHFNVLLSAGAASAERTTAALWQAAHKGPMRTALCAAFAAIAAALRTTHRRALLLSPASLYPLAARAEPLPAGRKELYALVCAAAWVHHRAAGGR